MAMVEFDFSEWKEFFQKLEKAGSGGFKAEVVRWLNTLGIDFLRIVEEEIKRRDVTNNRLLIRSFTKGEDDNCWEISDGGLTLEIGTHVDYASYVNDGHWTCGKGEKMRFVPGVWNGDKFEYIPGAKTGMVLKQKFVQGKPYWDSALRIFEKMFPNYVEEKLQQWIERYFGG